jgi:hypothetical protein
VEQYRVGVPITQGGRDDSPERRASFPAPAYKKRIENHMTKNKKSSWKQVSKAFDAWQTKTGLGGIKSFGDSSYVKRKDELITAHGWTFAEFDAEVERRCTLAFDNLITRRLNRVSK